MENLNLKALLETVTLMTGLAVVLIVVSIVIIN